MELLSTPVIRVAREASFEQMRITVGSTIERPEILHRRKYQRSFFLPQQIVQTTIDGLEVTQQIVLVIVDANPLTVEDRPP